MGTFNDIFQKYTAVVFFDVETTGFSPDNDRIIELAALKIEQTEEGTFKNSGQIDLFVKLPEEQKIPTEIKKLTRITDEMLEAEGVTEAEAARAFSALLISEGPVLMVAHNAQFDVSFIQHMLDRHSSDPKVIALEGIDFLDSLTVHKDRRAYPHKLADAIADYQLTDKVQNSHRAIDDVIALFEVCKAMDEERADLIEYVNMFGYNPKYGVSGRRINGINYWPQNYVNYIQPSSRTLPAKIRAHQQRQNKEQ